MSIEAIVGKLNKEALAKAVGNSEGIANAANKPTSFQEILTKVESGEDFANMLGAGGSTDVNPTSRMQAITGDDVGFVPTEQVMGLGKPETSAKVVDMLGDVNKGQMQMDSLVNHVLYSGKRFSNQELLVIQAHVFHFAQMTELTVKVAEQSISSVKSVLNTQVQ
jgi:hypothetical protein